MFHCDRFDIVIFDKATIEKYYTYSTFEYQNYTKSLL